MDPVLLVHINVFLLAAPLTVFGLRNRMGLLTVLLLSDIGTELWNRTLQRYIDALTFLCDPAGDAIGASISK